MVQSEPAVVLKLFIEPYKTYKAFKIFTCMSYMTCMVKTFLGAFHN